MVTLIEEDLAIIYNPSRIDVENGVECKEYTKYLGQGIGEIKISTIDTGFLPKKVDQKVRIANPRAVSYDPEVTVKGTGTIKHMGELGYIFTKNGRPLLRREGVTSDGKRARLTDILGHSIKEQEVDLSYNLVGVSELPFAIMGNPTQERLAYNKQSLKTILG